MNAIGHVDSLSIFGVSGWAANLDQLEQAVNVIIEIDGQEVGRVGAIRHREGLEEVAPGATGNYCFEFNFAEPLSPFENHSVLVRVAGADAGLPGIARVAGLCREAPASKPSLRPLIVTTMGRSGSTLLMGLLANHPSVIVADKAPFEVELLTYYAYALRHQTAPGDHVRSLRPDRITAQENALQLGLNPYFDLSYRQGFRDPTRLDCFLATAAPAYLADAFRSIVEAFYVEVAADRSKPHPIYFAEKALPEPLIRQSADFTFGATAEIVLVRDLRDVLCSSMRYGDLDFNLALESIVSAAAATLRIVRSRSDRLHVVRYEDLVDKSAATLAALFGYLGLSVGSTGDADALFGGHGTSANPQASIGRWRTDLDPDLLKRCERINPFQRRFGYGSVEPKAATYALPQSDTSADRDLMLRFESLGENCEFGLVQRQCGAEPLGLLRFSSSPLPKLLKALTARFAGMGQSGKFRVELSDNGREYMVHDDAFGLTYHAWVKAGEMQPQAIYNRELRRVPFLIRKLLDDLSSAEKTFVFHGMDPLTDDDAANLSKAVRAYGPANILWVEKAKAGYPPGSVRWVGLGLMQGFVDRFAPGENAHDLSIDCWRAVCRTADGLSKELQ